MKARMNRLLQPYSSRSLALGILLHTCGGAVAAELNATAIQTGAWNSPSTWLDGVVPSNGTPNAGDVWNVSIGNGLTVTNNLTTTIKSLTFGDAVGPLQLGNGTGAISITDAFQWRRGFLGPAGVSDFTLLAGAVATLDTVEIKVLGQRFVNNGTLNHNEGLLRGNSNARIFNRTGAVINIAAGQVLDLAGTISAENGSTVNFLAPSARHHTGTGSGMPEPSRVDWEFSATTQAMINLEHSVKFNGPGAMNGQWTVDSGATIEFGAVVTQSFNPTTINAPGLKIRKTGTGATTVSSSSGLSLIEQLDLQAGTFSSNKDLAVAQTTIDNGATLAGSGLLTIEEQLNFTQGTLSGTGKLVVPAGSNLVMDAPATGGRTIGKTIDVEGTLTHNGGNSFFTTGGLINVKNGGQVQINAPGSAQETVPDEGEEINMLGGVFVVELDDPNANFLAAGILMNGGKVDLRQGQLIVDRLRGELGLMKVFAGLGVQQAQDVVLGAALEGAGKLRFFGVEPGRTSNGSPTAISFMRSVNPIGREVSPGLPALPPTLTIEFDTVTLAPTNDLLIELNTINDKLAVIGNLTLGGDMLVTAAPGFTPQPGMSFEVITFTQGVSGDINVINNTGIAGLNFEKVVDADSLTLLVSAGGTPELQIAPTTVDFGDVAVGSMTSAPLVLSNVGSAQLQISALPPPGMPFALGAGNCNAPPFALAPGAQCQLGLVAQPQAKGLILGTLALVHNGAGPTSVPLRVTGRSPAPQLSSTQIGFGSVVLGTPSAIRTLQLTNAATVALVVGQASLQEDTEFAITADSCSGQTLAAQAQCSISLALTPLLEGETGDLLRIPSDAIGSPATVALTGRGVTQTVFGNGFEQP